MTGPVTPVSRQRAPWRTPALATSAATIAMAVVTALGTTPASAGTTERSTTASGTTGSVAAATTGATTTTDTAAATGGDWLHVQGNKIVDAAGNPVWLTGANWFGLNATERTFHGLWSGNINDITKSMADRGINLVRVPISTQLLLEWKSGSYATSNVNTYVNPELSGKGGLEIFDYWLGLCEKYGLKVMLDVHSAEADNSGHIAPTWYKGSITPEKFYQGWEWITSRYKNNDTIVAVDLKNEPHGKYAESPRAKWDNSTDVDNWKYTAETAAKKILAINPHLLVMVEGIEIYPKAGAAWTSKNESDYYNNWWGGNLRGVKDYPINLGASQNQLVYSPHDYGPLVYNQPWFQNSFNKDTLTDDVWRPNWLYIHESNTAPLLIGEWGGRLGEDARQDQWMTAMRDLIVENQLHHTFWCINPNSGDTGGLLLDDWKSWDEQKYAMLKPALWQYQGKFVGLDHEVPLGGDGSTTGITVAQRYAGVGPTADTTAPTAPGQPVASNITASAVKLTWTKSTDNVGVTGYEVLRGTGANQTVVATVSGTNYTVTGLTANTGYTFSVRARDAAGNVSTAAPPTSVTTAAGSASNGCSAVYKVSMSWSGGFMGEMAVTNTAKSAIAGWKVTWTPQPGSTLTQVWNGKLTTSGSEITVTNDSGNGSLPAGGNTTFGFIGSGTATGPETITCVAS